MAAPIEQPGAESRGRGAHPIAFGTAGLLWGRIERDARVVTLALVGEFDLASEDAFATTLAEIEASRPRALIVDLQGLSFMDSTGAKELLAAHVRGAGSHVVAVLNGSGPAHRALTMTGLDQHLLMVDDRSELQFMD